jgi:hypothetical protein
VCEGLIVGGFCGHCVLTGVYPPGFDRACLIDFVPRDILFVGIAANVKRLLVKTIGTNLT